jgi:FkbM family methyltransferase
MDGRIVVGYIARRLPDGRGRAANWLGRHPGTGGVEFVDASGHRRAADLRDHMERQWFAGVKLGMPEDVLKNVLPGDWAIDIGANIGITAGQLAARVGASGHVWAIEPLPRNVSCLRDFRERNDLSMIRILDLAAGAADGTIGISYGPGFGGWASVVASTTGGGTRVPVRTLDGLVSEMGNDGRLSLIKIDVEGYELQVLQGATETLARFQPLLYVEFNDQLQRAQGSSSVELLRHFREAGYRPSDRVDSSPARLNMKVVDLLLEPSTR